MNVLYAKEVYSEDLVREIKPLLQEHYEEIEWCQDKIKLNPDYGKYAAMYRGNSLRIYTARLTGKLIGYAVFFLHALPHSQDTNMAMTDVFFVEKSYRGHSVGKYLLLFAKEDLKSCNIQVIGMHIKNTHDWGRLAKRLGFEDVEHVWLQYIGK